MNNIIQTIRHTARAAAVLLLALCAAQTAGAWSGQGTEAAPYQITNASDLQQLADNVNKGTTYENVYFRQTEDIDCSTVEGTSTLGAGIGTASYPFKGRYDGDGKKIKNLRITATDSKYAGLFGYIEGGKYNGIEANTHIAEVHGVVLVDPTITITATGSEKYAGAIVGCAGDCSRIYDNTVIGGTVTYTGGSNYNTDYSYVGGIVGSYVNSNFPRLSGNTVVGTTLSGAGISGGLVGLLNNRYQFSGNFADASISGADYRTAGIKRQGALVGSYNHQTSSFNGISVNYYHSASGLTAYGSNYTYNGSSYSLVPVADNEWVEPLYTVSAPSGLTVSCTPAATHDGKGYYAEGAGLTIGTGSADKVFSGFTATGATASSLAADRRSATVTVGTADVTVSATLQTVSGTTADGLTWSLAQDDSGNYTRLTVGGNGAMQNYSYTTVGGLWRTTAPWGYGLTSVTIGDGVTAIGSYAFIGCQSLATATIGSSVATIGQQAFDHCDALVTVTLPASVTALGQGAFYNCIGLQRIDILHDGAVSLAANVFHNDNALQYITFPSIAALQANTTGNWSTYADKLRAKFGNQHFAVTTEGGTTAYAITTADDLRNLAAAVNATGNYASTGKTFRQTADIDLASGGNFTPIGSLGADYSFAGTYDGGGHTISGLTVSKKYGDIGLFGVVRGGTVRNVILLSPNVNATTTGNYNVYLGALIGMCNSGSSNLVENCHVVNPTVSSSSTDSRNYVGAIIGDIWGPNTTVTNCYYYGGNANAAYGNNQNGAPVTRVCAARKVTLGSGVSTTAPATAPENGFVYDNQSYYREGITLTLASNASTGYDPVYSAGGTALSGNTYTVNSTDGDVTISVAINPITYTVQFDGNGATDGTMSNQSFTYDVAQNLTANAFSRAFAVTYSYNGATGGNNDATATATATFNGWATSADGTVAYTNQQSVSKLTATKDATVSLYANWTDGSVTLPTPTKTGYTFGGWYSDDGLTASVGAAGASYTPSAGITLYAKWTPITYYMTYNLNGGSLTTEKNSFTVESENITLDEPTRTGYAFGGWYTNEELTGDAVTTIAQGSTENRTFYAKWTLITYSITYNVGGGTVATDNPTSYNIYTETFTLTNPTKPYYTFGGWYDNEGLTGDAVTTIVQGSTGDKTFYAKWTPITYDITYHENEGTLTTDKNSYTIESENITLDEPTRTGYAFCGWYTNEELTGDAVTTIAQGSTGNMELWARWTPFYTITYHLDGGTLTTDYDGYTVESPAITLDKPTRTGYAFGGWYTNEELTGDAVTTIAHGSTDHREYWAKWIVDWAATSSGDDADHAYMIYNKDQLDLLAHRVNGTHGETRQTDGYSGKYFRLGADIEYPHTTNWIEEIAGWVDDKGDIVIDNTENNFEAIGGYLISNNNVYSYFCGDFDGDGHTVSGIRIYSEDRRKGLFGQIGEIINNQIQGNANIHDLRLADACITVAYSVGGIVGSKYGGIVTRCHVASNVVIQTVHENDKYHGGIVGFNGQGTIDHCTSAATLTANNSKCSSFGAIAGTNYGALTDNLAIGATVPACSGGSHGAICGSNENNGVLERNYYIDCNVAGTANATGVGCHNADAGAVPGFLLSLSKGITSTALTVGDYTVAAAGQAVTLTSGTVPLGYTFAGFTVKKTADNTDVTTGVLSGNVTDGYTLTMPDYDVTVTHSLITDPWEGEGTKDSPYIILNHSQLDLLAERVNNQSDDNDSYSQYSGKYFKLGADIEYPHTTDWDCERVEVNGDWVENNENNFVAIGNTGQGYFCGDFDGDGHTVSGIRIYNYFHDNQGLFGYIGSNANIHDLRLADARITGLSNVGGIVGYNISGVVTRCHVASNVAIHTVSSYPSNYGGIVGWNYKGTIEQCTSAVTHTTNGISCEYCGGIAGRNSSGGTLRDNLAIGATVPATTNNTHGAIVGYNNNGTLVRNYYVNCKVAGVENATGVGCQTADVTTNDGAVCINTLDLTARQAPDGNYWTTYYNSFLGFTIDEDEHACAYTATYGGSQLTLKKLGKEIPAGTAVIIVAENSVVSMTATTALDDFSGTNDLRGVDVDTDVDDIRSDLGDGTFYVLGMTTVDNEKHFGFHRYTGEEMAAHKAYVFVSGSQARSLTMVFDEASGIESAEADSSLFTLHSSLSTWFTLDGRRLQAKPTAPGIYVNNGKKVVIK